MEPSKEDFDQLRKALIGCSGSIRGNVGVLKSRLDSIEIKIDNIERYLYNIGQKFAAKD